MVVLEVVVEVKVVFDELELLDDAQLTDAIKKKMAKDFTRSCIFLQLLVFGWDGKGGKK